MKPKILTFDCYGTLIDWKSGILEALDAYPDVDGDAFFETWWRVDRRLTCEEPYQRYRDILGCNFKEAFESVGVDVDMDEIGRLADNVGNWQPFSDTLESLGELKELGFQLGILSNIDNDLLARSMEYLGVDIDVCVTAEDVQSYKPAIRHFEALLEKTGYQPDEVLHIAASRFVDINSASQFGFRTMHVHRSEPDADYGVLPGYTVDTLEDAVSILEYMT